jgi:hypothetical protein
MTEQRADDQEVRQKTRERPNAGYNPEPIPWHFKLLGILFIPYLLFRLYQIAERLLSPN